MKTFFIPVKSVSEVKEPLLKKISEELPKNISICYSIQFKNSAEKIKYFLRKKHRILSIKQVLGCSKLSFSKETQAILLISNGRFHAVSLAFESKLPVFIMDNNLFYKISEKEIKEKEIKEKSAYLNYLNSEKVGIILTLKPGQQRFKQALDFKKKSKKKHYLFLCNNINILEFENFGLKSWINTACSRMDFDTNQIINLSFLRENLS
jgi:diphthamide biosynthesis enzyme Dph1/Dph2-like protein